MYYYLIRWHNEKIIVEARNGLEAVTEWFNGEVKQRAQEGQLVKFNPRDFSVEEIGSKVLTSNIIK